MLKKSKNKYNAKKIIFDGITFHSTLEGNSYLLLKNSKLDFDLQPKVVLQEKFKTKLLENVVAITYKPDFVVYINPDGIVEKHYIETKGFKTEGSTLRMKLFKKKLEQKSDQYNYFYLIKTLRELELLIKKLKSYT